MKGLPGVIVAVGLGFVAFASMWLYTSSLTDDAGTVQFVGVKQAVETGQTFTEDDFVAVKVPRTQARILKSFAIEWSLRSTLVGTRANRSYARDEFVLHQDVRAPARRSASERIGKDEVVKWVPIDTRAFVSQQVNPGDLVAFTLPAPGSPNGTQTIGPFEVLYLGARGGELDGASSRRRSSGGESLLAIRVKIMRPPEPDKAWDGKLETKAETLFQLLRKSGFQAAEVSLFSSDLVDG